MKYNLNKIQADYRSLLKWASDSNEWDKSMETAARKRGMNAIKRFVYLTELPVAIAMTYLRSPGGNCGPNFAQLFLDHAAGQIREYISQTSPVLPNSQPTTGKALTIGSRVRSAGYQSMEGIVIAIRGEQQPETVRHSNVCGVSMPSGGNAMFDIVFIGEDTSHVASNVYEATLHSGQWEILPDIASAEDIKAALARLEHDARTKEQNGREHAERLRQRAADYKKDFPFLELVKPGEPVSAHLGAVNLRNELGRKYPLLQFLVRSQESADGDAIDVQWALGPTATEVEVIASKYEQGCYDILSKCYKLNDQDAWTPLFGGAKYVRYGSLNSVIKPV